jgi:hypothetical protein
MEQTKQRQRQEIVTGILRLLKQVVNEAAGAKNTGGVAFSPA